MPTDEWNKKCFISECSGILRGKDCNIKLVEKQKKLSRKYRDEKHKSLKSMPESNSSEGRYKTILNDQVTFPALRDHGADYLAVPSSLSIMLLHSRGDIESRTFSTSIKFQVAVCEDETTAPGSKKVSILLFILLHWSVLPVRLSEVEHLVMDQNIPGVHLGGLFLHILGFSFKTYLTQKRTVIDNKSVEEICRSPGTLASLAYKRVTYKGEGEDPIEPLETLSAGFSGGTNEEISQAFVNILRDAQNNGLPTPGLNRSGQLLTTHRIII